MLARLWRSLSTVACSIERSVCARSVAGRPLSRISSKSLRNSMTVLSDGGLLTTGARAGAASFPTADVPTEFDDKPHRYRLSIRPAMVRQGLMVVSRRGGKTSDRVGYSTGWVGGVGPRGKTAAPWTDLLLLLHQLPFGPSLEAGFGQVPYRRRRGRPSLCMATDQVVWSQIGHLWLQTVSDLPWI